MKSINHIYSPIIPLLLFCFLFFNQGCNLGLNQMNQSVEIEVEKALDKGFDGIIVCVNKGGETKHYAAGWKNRENKIPVDSQSLFKIASISKLYIAVATTKLVVNQ
ncbi:MAG: serine hydrolase, partial [Bacteroidota bacterium]